MTVSATVTALDTVVAVEKPGSKILTVTSIFKTI